MSSSSDSRPIRFGTSGWRGVLADDFTLPRLCAATRGVARWFAAAGGGEVLVGHDTRFLSDRMAELAARVLAEEGLRVLLSRGPAATPAITRAVLRRRAAGALVLTASHNPPEYAGLKVFGPEGSCVDDASARRIEGWIRSASCAEPEPGASPPRFDFCNAYRRDLLRLLDTEVLRRSRLRLAYDAMHGAGAGVLDAVLEEAGVRVVRLRSEPDPRFGGAAPDPAPVRLRELSRVVRSNAGVRLGLATDGDADRFAALDARGRVLSETESLALLVDQLARTGRLSRGVAISTATGSLVARVAAAHGLPVQRHPIGFKHLSGALLAGEADVAGEESGGFAFDGFGRDKDGMLAAGLLAELVAVTRAPLGERLAELVRRHGPWACGRTAFALAPAARGRLEKLEAAPPRSVDAARVRAVGRGDGLHLALDDGFVMLRVSGTEPVLRVYAEARGKRALTRRLAAGAALLGIAGVSQRSR